ncbi:MAG: FAD-dependent oxidoreductase, partial [Proteobacteria bacterium]|nr:FAD-dependent oxidoreductase [Pseudomonadota bacterium]
FHVTPAPMTRALIEDVIAGYGDAANRLQRAGLAGCEIVASMGYLPAQFLNPRINRREDDYGGSFENRLRFLRGVLSDVRAKTTAGFVVGLRISGDEMAHDGLNAQEVIEVCKALSDSGDLNYLNVAGGSSAGVDGSIHIVPSMAMDNAYIAPYAARIKHETGMATLVAGRINQPHEAETVIAGGSADMCGMTRAMICDPEMPEKAKTGRVDDIRACIGCNQACIGHESMGYPISCIQHPETGRERRYGARKPARRRREVMVVGGGPGGMKAAAVASARGHAVTLYEAAPQLGGQVRLAQLLPGRAEFGGIVTNLRREMELAGVETVLNRRIDAEFIRAAKPDAVIVATGARPARAAGMTIEDMHVVDSWQVIGGEAEVGASVVIADWRCDWVGLGVAEKLAREGCSVRLCVNGYVPGQSIQQYVRDHWIGVLHKLGVEVLPYVRLYGADSDTVYFQHIASGEPVLCENVKTLVIALGHEREAGLAESLSGTGVEVIAIGDCVAPRTAEEAVLEGMKAAHDI